MPDREQDVRLEPKPLEPATRRRDVTEAIVVRGLALYL
jgi:hypothetical protein